MSADRGVDLDLLADYAGGALDGTLAYQRVARLVESDPRWAAALRELQDAETLVRAELAALGSLPEPLPYELAERLHAALAEAGAETPEGRPAGAETSDVEPARAETPEVEPAGAEVAQPKTKADVSSLAARRRRKHRVAAFAAAAAGVLALAGTAGYVVLGGDQQAEQGTTAARNPGAETNGPGAATAREGDQPKPGSAAKAYPTSVLASGQNYEPDSLGAIAARRGAARADSLSNVPAELERLTAPAALSGCLQTIRDAASGLPAKPGGTASPDDVSLVDYARFEGSPALIVLFSDGVANRGQVVVAGPDCGVLGADIRRQESI